MPFDAATLERLRIVNERRARDGKPPIVLKEPTLFWRIDEALGEPIGGILLWWSMRKFRRVCDRVNRDIAEGRHD